MAAQPRIRPRFIGRQAILDEKMRLYGHELLFRAGPANVFSGNSEEATNQIIDSCLSMTACSASKNLFINCTRDALVNMRVKLLPSSVVVLEILESADPDPDLINACKQLKQAGFRLALDDFSPDETKRELIKIADFIKVDFRASDAEQRREIYEMCRNSAAVFLAEKVETISEAHKAQAEGNTFFQGYFHSRPEVIVESQIGTNRAAYFALLAALAKPDVNFREIERLVLLEPSLCYKLLRLANSAACGLRYRISTIQSALNAVGEESFRRLVTVTIAGKLSRSATDRDVRQAIERANFCESLAPLLNENPAELYMLGMLSMMDQMLEIPMTQLVGLIFLDPRVEEALLGSTCGLGRALEICRYHELGRGFDGQVQIDRYMLDIASKYFDAVVSAGNIVQALDS